MPQKFRAIWRKFVSIPFLGGHAQKGFFEVIHRVQGVVHAKFGGDPSSSLGSKSKQINKQTPHFYMYR